MQCAAVQNRGTTSMQRSRGQERFVHKVCCPMHPSRRNDHRSHLTFLSADEADRPPRALFAPRTESSTSCGRVGGRTWRSRLSRMVQQAYVHDRSPYRGVLSLSTSRPLRYFLKGSGYPTPATPMSVPSGSVK